MKGIYKQYLIGALACLLTNCTKVELRDEASNIHVASLKVKYDWGNYASEKPEQMYLVAARILNTSHCYFTTSGEDGSFLVVAPEEPETPEVPETPEEPEVPVALKLPVSDAGIGATRGDATDTDNTDPSEGEEEEKPALIPQGTASILGGEYFMMAFTRDDERLAVLNLEEFSNDPSVSVKTLRLTNRLLDKKDYPSLDPDAKDKEKVWMDFNPGYKFVSAPGRVFVSRVNYVKFDTGAAYTQAFSPSTLTQRVFFTFTVEFDNTGVEGKHLIIDPSKLYIEIAGVIPEVGLADGLLYTNSVRRMFLTTEEDGVKTELGDDGNVKKISYKGYIDAFGLMPGPDEQVISGPGILRLAMKVALQNGENDEKEESRTIRTSLNVSKEIADANLTKATGYANVREKVTDEGTVRISRIIQVNTKKVIAGNSDGVVGWDQAFVDVDI